MDHVPVLVESVVDLLAPALATGGTVVDSTLGRAGHAVALLDAAGDVSLVGIDRDPEAVEASRARLRPYGDRARVVRGGFEELPALLERLGVAEVRGVLFDLGVSSPQLDDPGRGFGYGAEGPLDMRMDPSAALAAHEVVNRYREADLERVIRRFGEERFARRIARAIARARPIRSTTELAEIVRAAIPAAARRTGPHPARRTFQALRIEVNGELRALERGLEAAIDVLEPGGRVVVISYHSLEDRIVKNAFASEARGCVCPPDLPVCRCDARARVRILTRRPVRPSPAEVAANPRSRSARLRAAARVAPQRGDLEDAA
ncbi:MAG TPA: 16S rRNA (cytosine(1402)-N(4))-methyltransferase RsmH [Actinomycetota bacterium]|nr:16S rRNA (cytosine(1402)-N(4))-methyltransferase RsmH [Actinomycetota bacterium]